MKKTTLLTACTMGMITVTSMATYAVWDTVTIDSRENTVTMRNPVTIADMTTEQNISAAAGSLNPSSITASGKVKFKVQNTDSLATSLVLQEEIQASEKLIESSDYTISFTGTGVSGKTDSSVTDGEEEYDYTITFTEEGLKKLETNANQCKVKVTATLK